MTIDNSSKLRAALFGGALLLMAASARSQADQSQSTRQEMLQHGAALAARHCGACHLEPSADILPQRSWRAALGYMGFYLGQNELEYLQQDPEFAQANVASRRRALAREGVLPAAPLISRQDWDALRFYYLQSAPESPLPQMGKPPLRWELEHFESIPADYRIPGAITTLVRINESQREIYLGDGVAGTLTVLDGQGGSKVGPRRYDPPISPVDIEFVGDTAYLASIGDLMATRPTTDRPAHILALALEQGSLSAAPARVALANLLRLADIKVIDLNGDGKVDFLTCGFGGAREGAVSWFASQADGSYAEKILLQQPGAVRVDTHDFNGDGLLDVVTLLSDAREGLHILLNKGDGRFEDHVVFQTHPAYGHTYFELQDFNSDGLVDVLVVNGDNVDSDPYNTQKNYHGVRIYLNRGNLKFEQSYFYPMYGAYIAKAADFDEDGDLDIAAIAFFPDFSAPRPESFVILENRGDLDFAAASPQSATSGRWLTMDVGDIDGDRDIDVVLGGAYAPVGMFAHVEVFERLRRTGPSIMIFRNTRR